MSQFITKKDLVIWIESLISDNMVVAPVQTEGLILFRRISRTSEIFSNYQNSDLSLKDFFFPPSEPIFNVIKDGDTVKLTTISIEKDTVLFGIRPCDAKGIQILDMPFLAPPEDSTYKQHRDRTTLIGIACKQACPECFCTSMGTSPSDSSNMDVLLSETENGYIVNIVTNKGKIILKKARLEDGDIAVPLSPSIIEVPVKNIPELARGMFNSNYWDRVADRCIHCNICAYVCPVCYCFDIRDYEGHDHIERIRSWESCQAPGFTKIAGGYEPRPTKGAKLRQRFYHKLLYFHEEFGVLKCTGCGRCVRSCPVNIDIREIINDIQRLGVRNAR